MGLGGGYEGSEAADLPFKGVVGGVAHLTAVQTDGGQAGGGEAKGDEGEEGEEEMHVLDKILGWILRFWGVFDDWKENWQVGSEEQRKRN